MKNIYKTLLLLILCLRLPFNVCSQDLCGGLLYAEAPPILV